jgi:hypothetical protein
MNERDGLRSEPDWRDNMREILTYTRDQYRQRQLRDACGLPDYGTALLARLSEHAGPGTTIGSFGGLRLLFMVYYGLAFGTPEQDAAVELFKEMVGERNDIDGYIDSMEAKRNEQ